MDGLGGQVCVAMNLAPLAGQTPVGPGGDVAGETAPQESGRNNTTGGKLPGMSNIVKMGKNIFAKFEGYNWAKIASGNVTSQALGACLAGVQKPPRRVGKRFRGRLVAVPRRKVQKPAGLKTRPAWCRPAAATRTARRGVRGRTSLEAADGDDLVSGPDSDGEGAEPVA